MSERLNSKVKKDGKASMFLTRGGGQSFRQVSAVYDVERKFTLLALRVAESPTATWTYVAVDDDGRMVAFVSGCKTYKEADAKLEAVLA